MPGLVASMRETATGETRRARRSDIDLLRVVACYLSFPFHSAVIFGLFPFYHVKSKDQSAAFDVFVDFLHQWRMPLFFLVAGWSALAVLPRRTTGAFLLERVKRLLVPFAFGVILLCPIIKYIERSGGIDLRPDGARFGEEFTLSFFEFLPRFFGNLNQFSWSHLWFLVYLMVLSVVWLPLLRRISAMRPLDGVGWICLPLALLVLVQAALRPIFGEWPNLVTDWASLAFYSVFFLGGALLARHPGLEDTVRRNWPWFGAAGLVAYLGRAMIAEALWRDVLGAVVAWGVVLALVGFFRRWQDAEGPRLRYFRDSALPIYILHQLAVVALGAWVVGLTLPLPLKFLAVLTGAAIVTMAFYHCLVRPWSFMRRLLGMRPLPPAPLPAAMPQRADLT